jgi:ABC-type transport system involved in multi-copper enzyme maturation permease subunit
VNGTVAVARYTLVELTRRRILLVFFIIGALLIALLGIGLRIFYSAIVSGTASGPSAPDLTPAQIDRVVEFLFVSEILSVLSIFGLLIAFALGMTAIYHDLESGAAVSIFSKPVSRLAFTIGKLIAAVVGLVAIVGVLALEARLVMYLFGGGLENALWVEILATLANTLVLMLIVLSLSTWMNNIIAAVVAFIYYNVVAGVIVFLHTLADQGAIGNAIARGAIDVVYWLVPHTLTSSALHDIAQAQVQISGGRASTTTSALPAASGIGDVVWWAFVVLFFAAMVYYSVRRRQV